MINLEATENTCCMCTARVGSHKWFLLILDVHVDVYTIRIYIFIYWLYSYTNISAIIWKWINAIKCYKISISSWDVFSLNFHIKQLQRHCLLHTWRTQNSQNRLLVTDAPSKKEDQNCQEGKEACLLDSPPRGIAFGQNRGVAIKQKDGNYQHFKLQGVLNWLDQQQTPQWSVPWTDKKKSPKLLWPDQWLDSDKLRQLAGTFVNIHQSNMDVDMFHIEHEEIPWISICFCPVLKTHWFQLDISIPNSSWPQR